MAAMREGEAMAPVCRRRLSAIMPIWATHSASRREGRWAPSASARIVPARSDSARCTFVPPRSTPRTTTWMTGNLVQHATARIARSAGRSRRVPGIPARRGHSVRSIRLCGEFGRSKGPLLQCRDDRTDGKRSMRATRVRTRETSHPMFDCYWGRWVALTARRHGNDSSADVCAMPNCGERGVHPCTPRAFHYDL